MHPEIDVLDVLSKKGTMNILGELIKGKKRFSQLLAIFRSPPSLTKRLRELEKLRLIKRSRPKWLENPGASDPIHYEITKYGQEVYLAYCGLMETIREKSKLAYQTDSSSSRAKES